MKKIMDKFKEYLIINKKLYLFLTIILIIGLISGSLFTIFLNKNDKSMVINNLNDFFNNIKNNKINYWGCFYRSFLNNFFYVTLIWLLGISIIGPVFVVPVLYFKSFIVGFSISSFFLNKGFNGLISMFFYVFPHIILNIFIILICVMFSIIISFRLLKLFISKNTINFKVIISRYLGLYLISVFLITLTSLYETFIMPLILKVLL